MEVIMEEHEMDDGKKVFSYDWDSITFYKDENIITSGIKYAYIYDNESLI